MKQAPQANGPGRALTPSEVLALLPQKPPFLFLNELLEITERQAIGRYFFDEREAFYEGHFPGNPITPGVLLIEAMSQVGVVALGAYLMTLEAGPEQVRERLMVFTDAAVEFSAIVRPGNAVTTRATREFWRRGKLRSRVEMRLDDGTLVASGAVAGMWVRQP